AAERGHEVARIEEVAAALAHPLALRREEPAVDPDMTRGLETPAPEHRRPEDRVEPGNVLADHVEVGRPPAIKRVRVGREAGPGDVVDERVVPDVDDARLGIPRAVLAPGGLAVLRDRERDPPAARRALPADREVLEAAA